MFNTIPEVLQDLKAGRSLLQNFAGVCSSFFGPSDCVETSCDQIQLQIALDQGSARYYKSDKNK